MIKCPLGQPSEEEVVADEDFIIVLKRRGRKEEIER